MIPTSVIPLMQIILRILTHLVKDLLLLKKKGLEGSALVVTHLITAIEATDFQRNEGESDFGFSSINEIAKELDMILQLPKENGRNGFSARL